MELTKKSRNFEEYDAFNFLDDLVLNLLTEHEILSTQEITKRIQKKIAVTEPTIQTCLALMYLNNLVINQRVGVQSFYKITEEGNKFLREI
jgi:DNA-binding PadR family transcriptional regulator